MRPLDRERGLAEARHAADRQESWSPQGVLKHAIHLDEVGTPSDEPAETRRQLSWRLPERVVRLCPRAQ
jgi:hypothetical protein